MPRPTRSGHLLLTGPSLVPHEVSESVGRVGPLAVEDVRVNPRRERLVGVAEATRDDMQRDACREQERGVGVPQTVRGQARDAGQLHEPSKPGPQPARRDRGAVRQGEGQGRAGIADGDDAP